MSEWTQQQAIALCVLVEGVCPAFGCHVALTGGSLYKEGPRKDCDIVLYRHKREVAIDLNGLFAVLEPLGINHEKGFGFYHRADFAGKRVDFLCPAEEVGGDEYPVTDSADKLTTEDLLR